MGAGIALSIFYYSKRAPILASPPKGWGIQMNAFITGIIGLSLIIGQIITIFLRNVTFQEVFFILGTILAYIISYVLHFSFTTVGYYFLCLTLFIYDRWKIW
jgi:hypothetical protein